MIDTHALHEITSLAVREPLGTKPLFESDDAMADKTPQTDPKQALHSAMCDSVMAVYDDQTLTADQKIKKIGAILRAHKGGSDAPAARQPTNAKPVTEDADDDMTVNEALDESPANGSTLLEEHFDDLRMTITPRIF
jgi:hypothetical protein